MMCLAPEAMLSLLRTMVSMEKLVQRQTKALDYFLFLKLRKPLLDYTERGKVHFPKHTQNVTYLVSFPSILANVLGSWHWHPAHRHQVGFPRMPTVGPAQTLSFLSGQASVLTLPC